MSLPAPFNPDHFEFRLSPDRRQFAIWQPGNEPWFVPEGNMPGRWLKPNDMDRLGWTRYVPVDDTPPAAVEPSDRPRLFHLQRDHDVSGVSGTGRVANGVLWPDGTVSLRWIGERPSTVHWDRLADAEHVHGHGGATRIVWADEQPPVDRAAVLREAIDVAREEGHRLEAEVGIQAARGARTVAYLLRQRLVKDEQPEPTELKAAQQAQDAVLRIVAEVTTEANDVGGVDINDLVTRLQQAGYQLPDDES